jgi:hypothetical protein
MGIWKRSWIGAALLGILAADTSLASAPLGTLLIQRSDLKSGYRQTVAGYTQAPWTQNGSPLSPSALSRHGFVTAYRAQFNDPGPHPQPMVSVSQLAESALMFRSVAGARWEYQREITGTYVEAKRISMPRVGDESSWFSSFLPQPPPYEIALMFRQGRYVVRIALDKGAYSRSAALDLARLADRRIIRNG